MLPVITGLVNVLACDSTVRAAVTSILCKYVHLLLSAIAGVVSVTIRVRTIPLLGYWVLLKIHRYWVVL